MKLSTFRFSIVAFAFLTGASQLMAQEGVSSASVGVGRSSMHRYDAEGRYLMPVPEMFRVEEFVNYHRHQIPGPSGKSEKIGLSLQMLDLENGKRVYQIGLATPRSIESKKVPALNLVLVIDESGSMSGEKIRNLKQSLYTLTERFRKKDRITIVGFEHRARVILESCEKSDPEKINEAISEIRAGGSTNLHAGLMCGYEMAMKHYDPERTNRLIFLTDGNANVGVTESKEIARESTRCIKKGISLVTIGLGVDFNHGLLRELSDSGRGLMHYIGDSKDIEKVFIKDIESILMPAARKVKLTMDFGESTSKAKVYGYTSAIKKQKKQDEEIRLRLDDLNCGATQVVMVRVPAEKNRQGEIKLSYVDAITGESKTVRKKLKDAERKEKESNSVKRNYAIALTAESIQKAATSSNRGDNSKAIAQLKKGIGKARSIWGDSKDKPLQRVVKIAKKYQEDLVSSKKRKK